MAWRSGRRGRTTLAMLWAVLQVALAPLATIADARLERASLASGAAAHVESSSRESCPPAHQADCALCQVASRVAQAPQCALPAVTAAAPCPVATECHTPASALLGRLPSARAPPIG